MRSADTPRPATEAVYRRVPDVVMREVAGETILVPIRGSVAEMDRIFSLNATGALIWGALDGRRTEAEVLDLLVERFAVGRETAARDLREFLEDARAAGVAEAVGP